MVYRCGTIFALLIFILVSPALALEETPRLRAAVTIVPPFAAKENGVLTGFSIELWDAIVAQMKMKTSYEIFSDVQALEDALRLKRADAVVSPLAITLDRVERFDCSVPILQVGLQIMVRDIAGTPSPSRPFFQELGLLFSQTAFKWLGIALLLVLVPAHVVWLLERHEKDGAISHSAYFPGIFQAIYWALSCLATQADRMPHHWLARVVAVFWMFTGIAFVASYTAQLTSRLTVQQIRSAIEGPQDLPGKQVATIANTYAVDYLRAHNVRVQVFDQPDEMFQALLDNKVDAVVWESPILRYYATHTGQGRVMLVGREFYTRSIAIFFQLDSPLRRQVDIAMLALRENGTFHKIYEKWFGDL
jgi:polar amino acid transport system substrate-binding protein